MFDFRDGDLSGLPVATGGADLAVCALALTHVPMLAPFAYTLAGVACGPVFPTGLVWLSRLTGGNAAVTAGSVAATGCFGLSSPSMEHLV